MHNEGSIQAEIKRIKAEQLNISQQRFAAMKKATVRAVCVKRWPGKV